MDELFTLLGEARALSGVYCNPKPSAVTERRYRTEYERWRAGEGGPETAASYSGSLWLRAAIRGGAMLRLADVATDLEAALKRGDARGAIAIADDARRCIGVLSRYPAAAPGRRRRASGNRVFESSITVTSAD